MIKIPKLLLIFLRQNPSASFNTLFLRLVCWYAYDDVGWIYGLLGYCVYGKIILRFIGYEEKGM